MIILAAIAPERERYPIRFSVFKQAVVLTDIACTRFGIIFDIYSSVVFFFEKKHKVEEFLHHPKNRSGILVFSILIVSIVAAAALKFYRIQ